VRADVVGDDGRAQTFRRLTVHIAGPDGFGRDVPLEAVGAGRYAASLPLSRPGTYVATAKDEVSGEPVGTIGAVLTAGEELRPTGTDRVLLARIASMTGGRVRDTLAGLFDDRAARRFAYKPLVPLLVLVAACAMLVAVVAGRYRAWREDGARRRAERAESLARAQAVAIEEQTRLRDAIVARRQRDPSAPRDLPAATAPFRPNAPPARVTMPGAPAPQTTAPPPPAAAPPPPAERPLTAAERLALKRRERR
jgi:hypothetical protein